MLLIILFYLSMLTLITFIPNIFSTFFLIFIEWRDRIDGYIEKRQYHQYELCKQYQQYALYAAKLLRWLTVLFIEINSILIEFYAKLYHGYDVVGLQNIPSQHNQPALLICYHGILPTDMIFAVNRIYRNYGRFPRSVGDRFLFLFGSFSIKEYLFSGPASRCIRVLRDGHLLAISPGGTREAQFATSKYETLWNNRCGFARVAKEAQVDIVPIFTRNIRQVYILPQILQFILRPLYERIRIPVVPFIGGFPVKLITYIGQPIPSSRANTPEQLAQLVQKSIDDLIQKHQTFPATIWQALKERFTNTNYHCDKID